MKPNRLALLTCACMVFFSVALTLNAQPAAINAVAARNVAARPTETRSLGDARREIYKAIGDLKLSLYILTPSDHKPSDRRPAIVFFFGGGWTGGTPMQFAPQCRYLASRGMVAITADYRVFGRHGTPVAKCVEDARSAIRWVRVNAARLGIEPKRIAAGGGSAGGHLAACTALLTNFDAASDDLSISCVPDALVLFNPALVLAPSDRIETFPPERIERLRGRLGAEPEKLSPLHHVRTGAPPTLILHGKADQVVPYRSAEAFAEAMKQAGNRCELVGYDGRGHGFFNYRDARPADFIATTREMDQFFASLGWLTGPPTVERFVKPTDP
ncbi:MAG: alpha/beta hydrolase [Verrucomicrobiales bacterium]|nr:alpha/beta hydrolase [Verrucomicrobiales bacterium]